jgi:hypothetical protein
MDESFHQFKLTSQDPPTCSSAGTSNTMQEDRTHRCHLRRTERKKNNARGKKPVSGYR